MGIFKDMRTLSKQGKELSAQHDVGDQLQKGMNSMAQANQYLEQQIAGAALANTGTPAQLQVVASRDTGTVINLQPLLELELLVHPQGGVPYPTAIRQAVPMAGVGRVVPGSMLTGRVDPSTPTAIWIDWTV